MQPKLVNGHLRAILLETFMVKRISRNTQKAISTTFIPLPEEERELHAQKILDIINNSETEEEIIQKVQAL